MGYVCYFKWEGNLCFRNFLLMVPLGREKITVDPIKVLVVSLRQPSRPQDPGCSRLYSFCQHLSKEMDLTLLVGGVNRGNDRFAHVFRSVKQLPTPNSPSIVIRGLHSLVRLSSLDGRIRYRSYLAEVREFIRREFCNGKFDVIYVQGLESVELIPLELKSSAVVDLIDALSLLKFREANLEKKLFSKLNGLIESRRLLALERQAIRDFSQSIFISQSDADYVCKSGSVSVVANGVGREYFDNASLPPENLNIVFTGVMRYEPNDDAAIYFIDEILPTILEKIPAVKFYAVGSEPSSRLLNKNNDNSVFITGEVEDVRPYIQAAAVCVAPLRFGAGVKNKVLISMAMQRPIIGTMLSVEGLLLENGKDVMIAHSSFEFAEHVISLLSDRKIQKTIATNGYKFVSSNYSWERSGEQIANLIKNV